MVSSSSWLKSRLIRHHSTFSENRLNRSHESDILRRVAHAPERLHEEITADYNDHPRGGRSTPQGVHPQVAAQAPCGRRQPGGSRRAALNLVLHFSSVGTPPAVELDAAELSVRRGRQMPPLTTCPLQRSLAGRHLAGISRLCLLKTRLSLFLCETAAEHPCGA